MKPIFTIHAGEYLVGDYIEATFKNLRVWVPSKDTGIDLLATDHECKKSVSLQVKFSKDFFTSQKREKRIQNLKSGGWWTFQRNKIQDSPADLWVLVLYQVERREHDFIVIKPSELLQRYDAIHGTNKSLQSYIWVTEGRIPKCWETRGLKKPDHELISDGTFTSKERDLTSFLNNWNPLNKLKGKS